MKRQRVGVVAWIFAAVIARGFGDERTRPEYQIPNIAAGPNSLVGLKSNGTLVLDAGVGELGITNEAIQAEVLGWTDIVQASPGWHHLIALRKDGTVVGVAPQAATNEIAGISEWKDIVAVSSGYAHALGLKRDGTAVGTGGNWAGQANVKEWTGLTAIVAGGYHSLGLKKEGTVVATGANNHGQCNVGEWRDVVALAAGSDHSVALRKDGTVVATGRNHMGQCNVTDWTEIVYVHANSWQTIGLRKDGRVVTCGENNWKQQAMNGAVTDAVAVTSGEHFFVVLKPDGTIFCTGEAAGRRNAMGWNLGPTPPHAPQVRNRMGRGH